jgi:4-amino-4-deoxy-L-arabinose transferase
MTFGLIAGQAGYANLDPQFTFWVNLSLVALWFAVDTQDPRQRLIAWALLGFACGMGFMTKGFLAWLLPVLIALPWMLWQKRWLELVYGLVAMLVAVVSACRGSWRCMHRSRTTGGSSSGTSTSAALPVKMPSTIAPWWFYLPLLVGSACRGRPCCRHAQRGLEPEASDRFALCCCGC